MPARRILIIVGVVLSACLTLAASAESNSASATPKKSIDLQGHRGARGLLPENTIPSFLRAVDLGVTTLEMDVVINAQGHVVLSHEPWMSAKICSHEDGRKVELEAEKNLKIYAMSDTEVAGFDCGSRGHPDFPRQQAVPVSKPMLTDVLQAVAAHTSASGGNPVMFNIEIKSRPEDDRIFHPEVEEYTNALYQVLKQYGVLERTTIQSFDPRALEVVHRLDPQVSTAFLVDNRKGFQTNLELINFVPSIYSPYFEIVDEAMIKAAHAQNIRVIPWTVNDAKTMRKLLDWGVDGLITDYPDLGAEVLAE